MAAELKKAGFEVTENFSGNSVVGVLKNGEGPTLLIRTDMDALPIEEKTGLAYCSNVKMTDIDGEEMPVMHACGHDMHMTVFIGTANTLAKLKEKWKGTLVFIAQQAEERSGGAKAMIKSGLFSKFPKPDYCVALHVSAEIEAGKVGLKPDAIFASTDMIDITVYGKGGHGAIPQNAIDPIVLSARMITAFQTIVSREVSPIETALITVGSIHGGTKHNIIPDKVEMQLTVRTYSDETRDKIIEALNRISKGIAISAGLTENMYPKVFVRDESAHQ
ncbi:MAG: amidohydrolase [Chloroflexia bacterium]|nr:amidohydrolase [Chloroflexia bacterium]